MSALAAIAPTRAAHPPMARCKEDDGTYRDERTEEEQSPGEHDEQRQFRRHDDQLPQDLTCCRACARDQGVSSLLAGTLLDKRQGTRQQFLAQAGRHQGLPICEEDKNSSREIRTENALREQDHRSRGRED